LPSSFASAKRFISAKRNPDKALWKSDCNGTHSQNG
jgi:hypothetical protein